jgi:predicted nucleotidyltransferase
MITKLFKESILDPLQKELSNDLWVGKDLKIEVKSYIIKMIQEWMQLNKLNYKIENLLIAGSMTGYQYNNTSDIDVKVQFSISDEQIKTLGKLLPNGNNLPNTKHPINYFLLNKQFDLNNKGSVYDVLNNKWLVEPTKDSSDISLPYIVELAKIFMVGIDDRIKEYERDIKEIFMYVGYLETNPYDKDEVLESLERKKIEIEAGLDGLNIIFDMIHKFRDEAYQQKENPRDFFLFDKTVGHYSIQNQVWKILEKFGYLDLLWKYKEIRKKFKEMILK